MIRLIVEWLIPNRVIYTEMHGDMDAEAFKELDGLVMALLAEGTAPVHVISNFTQMDGIKASPTKIQNALTYLQDPKLGCVVMYGSATVVRYAGLVVFPLSGSDMRAFDTFEDCARFLGAIDDTVTVEELLATRQPIA